MTKINNFNEREEQELVPGVNDMNEEQELVPGAEKQESEDESEEESKEEYYRKRAHLSSFDADEYSDYLERMREQEMEREIEQEMESMREEYEEKEEEESKPRPNPPVRCSKNHHKSDEEFEEAVRNGAPILLLCGYDCSCDIDCSCKEFFASL